MYGKQISTREYWENKRAEITAPNQDGIRLQNILGVVLGEEFKASINANDSVFHYPTLEDYQDQTNPLTPAQAVRGVFISLGTVPQNLQNHGLPKCELVISLHAIKKALGRPEPADSTGRDGTAEFHSHFVKNGDMNNLTTLVAHPLAILPNPAVAESEESYLLVLDAVDKNGNQLVAPVRLPHGNFGQAFIPTIYGYPAKELLNIKNKYGSAYWSATMQLTNNIETIANLVYIETIKTYGFDSISSEDLGPGQEIFDEEQLRVDLENSTLLVDLLAKYKLESCGLSGDTGLFVVRPLNSQTFFPYGIITWKFSNFTNSHGVPAKNPKGNLTIWFCAKQKSEDTIWQQVRSKYNISPPQ
ncbi:hypothetical protein NO2_1043 [Candidatus Termititenax persephonae]|uniref:Uncharacterized protein n=1 Tax=Candidatus Termititenax persephonae TaxID=2218525 RepID=A0A388THY1_9BACT|nr:hypothetical protein NO2_1043 [Candidatus Termititenax persephonae]